MITEKLDDWTTWTSVGKPTIHLQGIGMAPAIPARLLEVGMKRLYNYGSTGEILSVQKTDKWIDLVIQENGKNYRRKHKPETMVAIVIDRI